MSGYRVSCVDYFSNHYLYIENNDYILLAYRGFRQ